MIQVLPRITKDERELAKEWLKEQTVDTIPGFASKYFIEFFAGPSTLWKTSVGLPVHLIPSVYNCKIPAMSLAKASAALQKKDGEKTAAVQEVQKLKVRSAIQQHRNE